MILKKNINAFEKIINYSFKKKEILVSALLHPSFLKEKKINKNSIVYEFERLEFLGDRVLGLAIASLIFKKFKKLDEGGLSKKLSYLVQKNFLYTISSQLNLNSFLKFSYKKQNSKLNISILADTVEAVIGAIYVDGGFKPSVKFIDYFWGPHFDVEASNQQDPKTKLQEISQQKYKKLPDYKLIKKTGPSHSPIFTVRLKVLNLKIIKASGNSIREAEKNAASIALENFYEKKNS